MRTIKNLIQNKATSLFFLFAFIFALVSFMLARNIISNYQNTLKSYDKNYNKEIFFDSKELITLDEITFALEPYNVKLTFNFRDTQNNVLLSSTSHNKFTALDKEFIKGKQFSESENLGNESIAIISSDLYSNKPYISLPLNEHLQELQIKGVTNDVSKEITLPFNLFKTAINSNYINDTLYIRSFLIGEPTTLKLALDSLAKVIKTKDTNASLSTFDLIKEDRIDEAKIFSRNSMYLIFLTILNSLILTSIAISIPALLYLKNLNINELLKGD